MEAECARELESLYSKVRNGTFRTKQLELDIEPNPEDLVVPRDILEERVRRAELGLDLWTGELLIGD